MRRKSPQSIPRWKLLAGSYFARTGEELEEEQDAKAEAVMNDDLSQLKKEEKEESRREEKEKLRGKIDNLQERFRARMERAKLNRERREREVKAKVHALELKAAKQRGDAKARIEARIESFRKKSEVHGYHTYTTTNNTTKKLSWN